MAAINKKNEDIEIEELPQTNQGHKISKKKKKKNKNQDWEDESDGIFLFLVIYCIKTI